MIIDDMAASAPYLRSLFRRAHIIRVPYQVFPYDHGKKVIDWDDSAKVRSVCPKIVSQDWIRPPFGEFIIVSQRAEPTALFVTVHPDKLDFLVAAVVCVEGVTMVCSVIKIKYDEGVNHIVAAYPTTGESLRNEIINYERWLGNNLHPKFGVTFETKFNLKDVEFDASHIAVRVSATLALMNCKNITATVVKPDPKLQEKRRKQGKLPLYSHHILTVHRVSKHSSKGDGTGEPLAVHWVRGHFKTYTAEKPLMGRHVGRFWFSPHLAGKAERVVTKEYRIKDEESD